MPQISDHNTVFLEVNLKAKTIKQKAPEDTPLQ